MSNVNMSETVDIIPSHTVATVGCAVCGVLITPRQGNMCLACLRQNVDLTEGITLQGVLHWCRGCERWLSGERYVYADWESRELLAIALKNIRGLNKVKLVDAGFIWTEPHSRRVKVQLTVQKEVFNGAILEQVFEVNFVQANQFCTDCHALEAENTWTAVVQVRQKVPHKRTFFHLEQLILKHSLHMSTVGIQEYPDGLDFYFRTRSGATKLTEFLQSRVPLRLQEAKKLVSQDDQNNTYKYKYTVSVEIAPICKGDIMVLPRKLGLRQGNIFPLVLCTKVASVIHVIDVKSGQTAEINALAFWKSPFRALASRDQLSEFVVLDIEPIDYSYSPSDKFVMADATVARAADLGVNDVTYSVTTHLGHLLSAGDHVMGFDLTHANYNDVNFDKLDAASIPDVVIVKKSYTHIHKKRKRRTWTVQTMAKMTYHLEPREKSKKKKSAARAAQAQEERDARDKEIFLREIEEDPELRAELNLYRAEDYEEILRARAERAAASTAVGMEGDDDSDVDSDELPDIPIEDLLDPLKAVTLDDPNAPPDEDE